MQVTLNIDANLAGSVQEVFSSLTDEDKRSIAYKVMTEFLTSPHGAERKAKEESLIAEYKRTGRMVYSNSRGYTSSTDLTDEEVSKTHEFREEMTKWKSTKNVMVEEIVKTTIENYRSMVKQLVESDPAILAAREEVLAQIKADFPAYVHDAMSAFFVTSMTSLKTGLMNALMKAERSDEIGQRLLKTLNH